MTSPERSGMRDCNTAGTLSVGELSLAELADTLLDEIGIETNQSLTGSHLSLPRPNRWDMSYAALVLTRATSKSSEALLTRRNHVLAFRMLNSCLEKDIVYMSGSSEIQAWAGASYVQRSDNHAEASAQRSNTCTLRR